MTLKPYHEHELLHVYEGSAEFYCTVCDREIAGPPWVIGDYVVTSAHRYWRACPPGYLRRLWRVYPLGAWKSECRGRNDGFVFESTRKREALKHARELDRGCKRLLRALETGDAKLLADIHRDVKRVEREERDA